MGTQGTGTVATPAGGLGGGIVPAEGMEVGGIGPTGEVLQDLVVVVRCGLAVEVCENAADQVAFASVRKALVELLLVLYRVIRGPSRALAMFCVSDRLATYFHGGFCISAGT